MQPICATTAEGMQTRKKNTQDSNADDSSPLAMVVRKSGMAHLVESQSSDFMADEKWV